MTSTPEPPKTTNTHSQAVKDAGDKLRAKRDQHSPTSYTHPVRSMPATPTNQEVDQQPSYGKAAIMAPERDEPWSPEKIPPNEVTSTSSAPGQESARLDSHSAPSQSTPPSTASESPAGAGPSQLSTLHNVDADLKGVSGCLVHAQVQSKI
jgi:hypothetical protein